MNYPLVHCPKCNATLLDGVFNLPDLTPCPSCGDLMKIEVFPALFRRFTPGQAAETILVEGEAGCFYHPRKKAVFPCDACGRFLCALCDCVLDERHYCPACLEAGGKKRTIEQLETVRPLHGRQAFMLSVLPFFITGLAAIFIAIRHWKSPGSLVSPQRWQMPVALVLAILQTLCFLLLIIGAFIS